MGKLTPQITLKNTLPLFCSHKGASQRETRGGSRLSGLGLTNCSLPSESWDEIIWCLLGLA